MTLSGDAQPETYESYLRGVPEPPPAHRWDSSQGVRIGTEGTPPPIVPIVHNTLMFLPKFVRNKVPIGADRSPGNLLVS
jgi:hypothetical protein